MKAISRLRGFFDKREKTTASMAGITRLSEQQYAALQGVQIGDLIFVQNVIAPTYDEENSESDDEDHDGEDAGGPESGDEQDDDDGQEGGEEEGNDDDSASAMDDDTSEGEAGDESSDQVTSIDSSNSSVCDTSIPPRMYVVSQVTAGTNGGIIDLQLSQLQYAHKISSDAAGHHTYQIHGKKIVHQHPSTCGQDCVNAAGIADVVTDENFRLTVKPDGDIVRYADPTFRTANPHTRCIAECVDGWLGSMQGLIDMIPDYDPPVLSIGIQLPSYLQPTVCPVCIGDELCKEQQALQATFMLTAMIDLGDVVEFQGKLNRRRRDELGYSFKQFDEREWGMHFDDMQSEDESEAGDDDDRFEHWAEAMDPSSVSVQTRPASAITIAALPRKSFTDAQLAEGTECQVCKDGLADDSVLVELPCGHVHFHQDCIVTWLLQFDTCPDCRKQVPPVAEPEVASEESVSGENEDNDVVISDE